MRERGRGYTFLRGNVYWCSFYLNGVEQRESTKQTDPKKAERYLNARLDEAGAAKIGLDRFTTARMAKQTVHDLLEELKSDLELRGKLSAQNLSGINCADQGKDDPKKGKAGVTYEGLGQIKAVNLRPAHIDKFIKERLAEGYAVASVNRIVQFVEQAFRLAIKQERLVHMPYFRRLSEVGNARTGFVEESTFRAIHANLAEHLKDLVEFMYATGMRLGEAKSLAWRDVDGDCLKLMGVNAKNGRTRIVPMIGQLAAILERRKTARQFENGGNTELSALIFHKNGRRIGDFRKRWAAACEKAGAPGILVHDLRRSAARNLDRAGVRRDVARAISGHRTDSMYSRYNITSADDVRAALVQTEAYREATRNAVASNVRAMQSK